MTKSQVKIQIEKIALKEGVTFIKACQHLQGAAAKLNNEEMIATIHELKMENFNL